MTGESGLQEAFAWAVACHRQGRAAEAEAGYRRILAVAPLHAHAWYNLADLLRNRGEEAEAAYRRALAARPDFAEAWFALGNLLEETRRPEEAEAAYRQAIRARPGYAEALYNLGVLARERGALPLAEDLFREAILARPEFAEAWNNLGDLLLRQKRYAAAGEAFLDAVRADPGHAGAHYNRVILLIEQQRLVEAGEAVREALRLPPGGHPLPVRQRDGMALRAVLHPGRGEEGAWDEPFFERGERGDPPLVLFDWQANNRSGWGVYGTNLALHATVAGRIAIAGTASHPEPLVTTGALWQPLLGDFHARANRLREWICRKRASFRLPWPILHGLGNGLHSERGLPNGLMLNGSPGIGVVFLEETRLRRQERERVADLALIVAGSTWNQRLLEDAGIGPVTTVLQGVDPVLFHPAPRLGWLRGRFTVFSGGKLEFRKGQDLVVLAFRAFAQRHPEALLVTAWHSTWPEIARNLEANPRVAPVVFAADGAVDCVAWARANGIRAGAFLDLGPLRHEETPAVLREMDVAIFPNRCEGGTNLVAMECMACGVPVILSRNTGHLDLIREGSCLPLTRQTPLADGENQRDWGESDIEEMVEALEFCWREREGAAAMGERGAAFMREWSWERRIGELTGVIEATCGWPGGRCPPISVIPPPPSVPHPPG
ncbi:MAG: tetratricopeptide repeat protein [Magnetococcales bacterium]|nr:tetratricopeptide repeat protein [Magnetococcales bacterium]